MDLFTTRMKLADIFPKWAKTVEKEYGIKEPEYIRKGITPDDLQFEEGERAVIAHITTNAVDRDKEIVDPDGVDLSAYEKNKVVLWCHKYDILPIGRAQWIKRDDKGILAKTEYHTDEFADRVYNYRKDGFPLMESIGFIPVEWEDFKNEKDIKANNGAERRYTKWILLEYSDVPVGSNPEALAIAVSKGILTEEEVKKITKPEETDEYIRIPVRECKVTATIDISAKEGIKALYCGKEKKVRTYLFAKAKDWDMAKAKAWVKKHDSGKAVEEEGVGEEKQTYACECIKCGYKMDSKKHCADIKCPECGGQMRRAERPGPGQESLNIDTASKEEVLITFKKLIKEYPELIDIIKEGRVLSTKNRKLVKQCADMLLELYEATELAPKEENIENVDFSNLNEVNMEGIKDEFKAIIESVNVKKDSMETIKEAVNDVIFKLRGGVK